MRIAIVEDDLQSADRLRGFIETYQKDNIERFQVTIYNDGADIVNDFSLQYDIILLDVRLRTMDGFTAAGKIRAIDKDVVIIFITNMAQSAIEGYKVDALNYLLKPVSYFAFAEELKRATERLAWRRRGGSVVLRTEHDFIRVATDEILYIETDRHRLAVHTTGGVQRTISTMKEMEAKLKDRRFFRCNNCFLVNMSYVKAIEGNFAIIGSGVYGGSGGAANNRVQISRPRKKAFLAALTDFLGG